uniref:histidine kinase n=1 Tax=Desulfovibrio sp. U5L TaxID=596152 RepID=I2Q4J3_9BACT
MYRSIKTQMFMGQLALVVLLTVALGGGVFHVAAHILETKAREKIRLLAAGLAREAALVAGHGEATLTLLTSSPQFDQFCQSHNPHLLQALFDRYRGAFTSLAYVNPKGVREYAASGPGYTDRGLDLSRDRIVAEALAAPGRTVWGLRDSPRDGTPLLAMAQARRTPFGEDMGLLLAALPLRAIAPGLLSLRLEEGGIAVLADVTGTLLFAESLRGLPDRAGQGTSLARALADQKETVLLEPFAGEASLIAVAPVGQYGLSTLVALPRRLAVDAEIGRLRRLVAAIAAAAAFLSTLAALWWTGGIARPLARLADAARAVSGGDLGVRARADGPAEARDLAQAFNAMTEGLAASRDELTQAKHSLENILANMNEAILAVDRQGRVTMLNRAGCAMLGYAPGEAAGRPAASFFPPGDPLCAFLDSAPVQDLLASGGMTGLEKTLLGKEGRTVPVLVSVALLRGPGARVEGVVCLAMDITEHKRADDLARARKAAEAASRAKTEFLAVLSHEMRTPLNIILGILDHMEGMPLPPDTRAGLVQALAAGTALHEVIVAMLDYASLEAGRVILRRESFSPRQLAMDLAGRFAAQAKAKGVGLAAHVAPDMPTRLAGDPARLAQALGNLLANAVRFTERGEAALFLSLVPAARGPGGPRRLLAVVTDTGLGVTDAKLEYVFEPFTQEDARSTRRFGGLGLGLAIARRLAGLMGGTICMDSRPGKGTDVYVSLPVGEDADGDDPS